MRQHPSPLTRRRPPGLPALRDRVRSVRVPHRPEREQPRHRRQPQIDRRRRQRVGAAAVKSDHVRTTSPARHPLVATGSQEPQQHIRRHRRQVEILTHQPATERQQTEPVRSDRAWRIVPISQIRQIVVHQPEPVHTLTGQPPPRIRLLQNQPVILHSHMCNDQRTQKQAPNPRNQQIMPPTTDRLAG